MGCEADELGLPQSRDRLPPALYVLGPVDGPELQAVPSSEVLPRIAHELAQ